jgi:hypothetical protein
MVPNEKRQAFNDDRRRLFAETPEIAFVCECQDVECTASVVLSPRAYDAARALPPHRLLHESHRAG